MMMTCRCELMRGVILATKSTCGRAGKRVVLFGAGAGCELPYLGG